MQINQITKENRSVLVITHSYAPMLNPRAFRWTSIAEEFVKRGVAVDVITSWKPGYRREEKINGVNVFRVGESIIEKMRSMFNSEQASVHNSSAIHKNPKTFDVKNIIKNTIQSLHDITWKNIYWPDYAILWIKDAVKAAIYLNEIEKYDSLITVSDPFSCHLVGQKVKQLHPNMHWLVDIGDPFSFREGTRANNHKLYKKKNYNAEYEIFKMADDIAVTTETTKDKYSELFLTGEKIAVIPPLVSQLKNQKRNKDFYSNKNSKKILYIGTLYKHIRNPQYLLDLFLNIKNSLNSEFELHFIGGINDCQYLFDNYDLNKNNIYLHGLLDRAEVNTALQQADFVINLSNTNRYQLPSKVVEYVQSGKPIINITQIENDISAAFFNGYEHFINIHQKEEYPTNFEIQKFREFLDKEYDNVDSETIEIFLSPNSIDSVSQSYFNLIFKNNGEVNETITLNYDACL